MTTNLLSLSIAPLIDSAIFNTKETIPDHWATLLGERSSGSQFGFNMSEKIIRSIPWELTLIEESYQSKYEEFRMSKYKSDCIYLTCKTKNMPLVNIKGVGKAKAKMTNNIKLLPEIARSTAKDHRDKDILIPNFYPHKGEHGWELRSADVNKSEPASCISMVIGKHGEQLVIYTIHPDPVAEPLPEWFTENGDIKRLMDEIQAQINVNQGYSFRYALPQYAIKAF
jgi:hypothetical protein